MLVILDAVRADHTSLCGYGRPTTPTLETLAQEPGASWTCDAYAPGSWTLPTLASLFTGLEPVDHGAHAVVSGTQELSGTGHRSQRLAPEYRTLAEELTDRGWLTVLVSANPILQDALGLTQGFARRRVATGWDELRGDALGPALARALPPEPDPRGRPLLLVVNLIDAHEPWDAIPPDAGWVPPRPRLAWDRLSPRSTWRRFLDGRLSDRERARAVARATDLYDHGVRRADANLREVLSQVRASGWCRAGCRVAVTSDHGELLGEHGLLDHSGYTLEPLTRVPLVLLDSTGAPPLSGPVSLLDVHTWLLEGRLPDDPAPVRAWAWPNLRRCARTGVFCETSVSWWEDGQKLSWRDRALVHVDLSADPGEDRPLPLEPDHPRAAELEALGRRALEARGEPDPAVEAALQALGYLD